MVGPPSFARCRSHDLVRLWSFAFRCSPAAVRLQSLARRRFVDPVGLLVSTGPSEATVMLVTGRDENRCARCGSSISGERGVSWSIHHRVPRGAGGAKFVLWINLPANLLLLCGSGTTGCHGWVEGHRAESLDLGWLMLRNAVHVPEDVPVPHAIHGLVLLDNKGGYREVGAAA